MGQQDLKSQELAAIVRQIRDRVEARYPEGEARGIGVALPDLMPVLHARDVAEAKVAAIGSVNPRPGGPINSTIQFIKRQIARGLGWFIRDQVDFNRASVSAIDAALESMNEVNRTFVAVGQRLDELRAEADRLRAEASELKDIRVHWLNWREQWEKKLLTNEIHFLRSVSDLQAATQLRVRELDTNYRESLRLQHSDFEASLRHAIGEIQQRLSVDFEKFRRDYDQIIHSELRLIRQRSFGTAAPSHTIEVAGVATHNVPDGPTPPPLDYMRFAERFRGSEEYVRRNLGVYRSYFQDMASVLDIGCGRGEFLEMMREMNVGARGIDLDPESVALCRSKGLEASTEDLFDYLAPEEHQFDAIFASQVIEHLPTHRLPEMIRLCAANLRPRGLLILETPNPECLAIFATHFYLDPTHVRPIPPALAVFYMEESGFGGVEVRRLSPAIESMPALEDLPERFRDAFFGGLDYAVIGRKL